MTPIKNKKSVGRPDELSDATFSRVCKMIHQRAGISLGDGKRMLVYGRLNPLLRRRGLKSFDEYLALAEKDTACEQEFVNALTTNLTSFFREKHHFDLLGEHLQGKRPGKVKVWCAAASTGEEPYSIAITCKEMAPAGVSAEIVATDIDTTVLAKAHKGLYQANSIRGLSPDIQRKYFGQVSSSEASMVGMHKDLRSMIKYQQLNLSAASWQLPGPFDFVFLRNVLIYFEPELKTAIIRKIHRHLKPGGVLIVGHSEHFREDLDLFKAIGRTSYTKVER